MEKKTISICVPVYNEEAGLHQVYDRVTAVMKTLPRYEYELVFFDDGSTDGSRGVIEELCLRDGHVRAVFYAGNFGYSKTIFYCMQQAKGDCSVLLHADLQNPPEVIPRFVEAWEAGAQIVQGVKKTSRESPVLFFFRSMYYWLMNHVFGVRMVPHATEFHLFDASFISVLRSVRDNHPFLRGLVLEYGGKTEYVTYVQEKRNQGKTRFNLSRYYDFAINGVVSTSDRLPRRLIAASLILFAVLLVECICFFCFFGRGLSAPQTAIAALCHFAAAGILFLQLFAGLMFEYVIGIARNTVDKPLIVEERRIGY